MSSAGYDAIVVGAGIVGLAHAYHLARSGRRVAVFERSGRAVGASIRNFGMIWPIGQTPEMRPVAMASRAHWLEVLRDAGIWHRECGSLHLAYREDEFALLEEFVGLAPGHGYRCEMVSSNQVLEKSPVVREKGLIGGMWSPDELCVFPRDVIAALPEYLRNRYGVEFYFGMPVSRVDTGRVICGESTFRADWVIVCPGDDLKTLFREVLDQEEIRLSKLQMLRARPKGGFHIGAHICAGLTLRHYANFSVCPGLPSVTARLDRDHPYQARWGIHLLVSQHEDGCLTIGDSHEYPETPDPFLSAEIERLILEYLDTFLPVEELEVIERWHGVYAKHMSKPYVLLRPYEKVAVLAGIGGTGMTLSFGLAERVLGELNLLR